MKRPKFSVIVPVYKVEEYLETCVNSLLAQGMEEGSMEILLVDDGSPDRNCAMNWLFLIWRFKLFIRQTEDFHQREMRECIRPGESI